MITTMGALFVTLTTLLLVVALPVVVLYMVFRLLMGVAWVVWNMVRGVGVGVGFSLQTVGKLVRRIAFFVRSVVLDVLRFAGATLTALVMIPPVNLNIFTGRWSRANHYGKALEREVREMALCLYRIGIAHPTRLFGLNALTEGLEKRLPEVVAKAPGPDRPKGGFERFDGYRVVGSLPQGGSGARIFLAEPGADKRTDFVNAGYAVPDLVVIKSFSLAEGSTMPQIVRESRALGAARELGLVLDHRIEDADFYYVMAYVPGDDLSTVVTAMHSRAGEDGLDAAGLADGMRYGAQILETLDRFHRGGLWHKDIKPSNVIVSPAGRAHLVDFGLVTPLRSAMTLTTHGTEYFRDPEIVRLAMRGVKVNEVDGVKFDLYSIGALMYSVVENSFPAHGSLSRINKRCPEALRWIVRRAMADMRNRYSSAREMLADLAMVMDAEEPFAVQPADLPSLSGQPYLAAEIDAQAEPDEEPDLEFRSATFAAAPPVSPRKAKKAAKKAAREAKARTAQEAKAARRRARRSGVRSVARGALLAVLCFSFVGAGVSLFAAGPRRASAHVQPVIAQTASALRGVGEPLSSIGAELRRYLPTDTHSQARAFLEAERQREEGFDLLVVNDSPGWFGPELTRSLSSLLEREDLNVVGLADDWSRSPHELEWLALARKAVGVSDLGDPGSLSRLHGFLRGETNLDAILWLGRGDHDDQLRYQLVTADTVSDSQVLRLPH